MPQVSGNRLYRWFGKRLFDVVASAGLLIVLSPLLTVLALLVRIRLGSPVIFRQPRPGKNGDVFTICKFRTMTDACDVEGRSLPDAQRLTPFGRWLRSSSLDELPELWNVLRGEMSLVGPRPLMTSYLQMYSPDQTRRHDVLPGITGWAQVHGRNTVEWAERFKLDVWYVDRCNVWLDLKILWMTLATVVSRAGITAEGHSTMPEFTGDSAKENAPKIVVVIGAGGHGKVVVSTLQSAGVPVDAVYDDDCRLWGKHGLGVPIRGPVAELLMSHDLAGVIGIGNNAVRQRLSELLPLTWLTTIHPRAFVHPSVVLGRGTVVFAGAVIQPDVIVGEHTIVNTMASLDHDCRIGNFVAVGPGTHLSGTVSLGDRSFLGTGCSVMPNLQIADDVTVGAGTVVIRDLPRGCTLVGSTPRMLHFPCLAEDGHESA